MSDKVNEMNRKGEQGGGMPPLDRRKRTIFILAAGAVICMAVTIFLLYNYHKSSMESEMALESLRALEGKPVAGEEMQDAVVSGGIPLIGMEYILMR